MASHSSSAVEGSPCAPKSRSTYDFSHNFSLMLPINYISFIKPTIYVIVKSKSSSFVVSNVQIDQMLSILLFDCKIFIICAHN